MTSTSTSQITLITYDSTFSNPVFVIWSLDWSVDNWLNLWWDVTNQDFARQWPCPAWYHVPSKAEWTWLILAWDWNWKIWNRAWTTTEWTDFWNALKLPMAGYRYHSNGIMDNQWAYWFYWTSTPDYTASRYATDIRFYATDITFEDNNNRPIGFPVRCFKD